MPEVKKPKIWTTHKDKESSEDNQDKAACRDRDHYFSIALSDGATESFLPALWSSVLANCFAESPFAVDPGRWNEWFSAAQATWLAEARAKVTPTSHYSVRNSMQKQKNADATLVGLVVGSNEQGTHWKAIAVGDSCLFHLSEGRLKKSLPKQESAQFSAGVKSLRSYPGDQPTPSFYELESAQEGDVILLASDAISKWLLMRHEMRRPAWGSIVHDFDSAASFEEFVAKARLDPECRMDNDDTTVVVVCIGEPHPALLTQKCNFEGVTLTPQRPGVVPSDVLPPVGYSRSPQPGHTVALPSHVPLTAVPALSPSFSVAPLSDASRSPVPPAHSSLPGVPPSLPPPPAMPLLPVKAAPNPPDPAEPSFDPPQPPGPWRRLRATLMGCATGLSLVLIWLWIQFEMDKPVCSKSSSPSRNDRPQPGGSPSDNASPHSEASTNNAQFSTPQQGTPQQGTPQQGTPQQGTPQQGTPQQGTPQQGTPQQGTPQQGTPQQGTPQQGTPQQGTPQQGTPQQGTPQQGPPPSGAEPPQSNNSNLPSGDHAQQRGDGTPQPGNSKPSSTGMKTSKQPDGNKTDVKKSKNGKNKKNTKS